MTTSRTFDLNIEKILEGWEISHAIREVIANAIDEQSLTGSKSVEITKGGDRVWHVRDYGRGLKYQHLTQNENIEKLQNAPKVIGKFGVGLKDAFATLHRNEVGVKILSKHGDITLELAPKSDFGDVLTLHAVISRSSDPKFAGTDFTFNGISDGDIDAAKNSVDLNRSQYE